MTIAVRKSTYDGLNATQKAVVRWTMRRLQLGEAALYVNASAVQQYVFDDSRIDLDDVAVIGCVGANLALLANQQNLPEGPELRQQVRDFVASRIVWPADIPGLADAADPYQAVLTAQGAPGSVRAGAGIPAGWSPVA
jgi:hypothetical protein